MMSVGKKSGESYSAEFCVEKMQFKGLFNKYAQLTKEWKSWYLIPSQIESRQKSKKNYKV